MSYRTHSYKCWRPDGRMDSRTTRVTTISPFRHAAGDKNTFTAPLQLDFFFFNLWASISKRLTFSSIFYQIARFPPHPRCDYNKKTASTQTLYAFIPSVSDFIAEWICCIWVFTLTSTCESSNTPHECIVIRLSHQTFDSPIPTPSTCIPAGSMPALLQRSRVTANQKKNTLQI